MKSKIEMEEINRTEALLPDTVIITSNLHQEGIMEELSDPNLHKEFVLQAVVKQEDSCSILGIQIKSEMPDMEYEITDDDYINNEFDGIIRAFQEDKMEEELPHLNLNGDVVNQNCCSKSLWAEVKSEMLDMKYEITGDADVHLNNTVHEELIIKDEAKETVSHEYFYCALCNGEFKDKHDLKQHLSARTNNPFQCKLCDYKCIRICMLQKHSNLCKEVYQCSVCNFKSIYKGSFTRHMQMHTAVKPFMHDICESEFIQQTNLQQHIHLEEKPYNCKDCNYKCARKFDFQRHVNMHMGEKPFNCSDCNYKCSRKSRLQQHIKVHTGEKPFLCNICDFKFTRKVNLQLHMLIHTGKQPFICNTCDAKFTAKNNLQFHMKKHTGEKPFNCNECDYKCTRKSLLKHHMKMHTGDRPFVCNVCDAKFTLKSILQLHMKIHTGEKPFNCNECDYKCARTSDLRNHMMRHTGEKPFSCNECDYKCARKSHLQQHIRRHMMKRICI